MAKVKILTLDARSSSVLDWSAVRPQALGAIGAGYQILWNLDLGLFQNLSKPLSVSSQFLTAGLALDHFRDTLWKEFHRFSLGVSLYQGDADYLTQFIWDEEQRQNFKEWQNERHIQAPSQFVERLFTRDVCAEYIEQLAARLPDEIPAYVIFDTLPEEPLLRVLLTDPERYGRVFIYTYNRFAWRSSEELSTGVLMPPLNVVEPALLAPFGDLLAELKGSEYKLIPESNLTTAWDGLDLLYYSPRVVSAQGERKIKGFCAAGGTISEICC